MVYFIGFNDLQVGCKLGSPQTNLLCFGSVQSSFFLPLFVCLPPSLSLSLSVSLSVTFTLFSFTHSLPLHYRFHTVSRSLSPFLHLKPIINSTLPSPLHKHYLAVEKSFLRSPARTSGPWKERIKIMRK